MPISALAILRFFVGILCWKKVEVCPRRINPNLATNTEQQTAGNEDENEEKWTANEKTHDGDLGKHSAFEQPQKHPH
jgi:hypothetical protein